MNIRETRAQYPHVKPYTLVHFKEHGRLYTGEVMSYPCEGTAMVRRIPGHPGTLMEMPLASILKRNVFKQVCMARVLLPWNNLGCLGFSCGNLYADVFMRPQWGMFVRRDGVKTWYGFRPFRTLKREVA